ncbi:MAG: NADH-quinone oxidoreductase subunit C [gamma proteobacterium symbiont of Bathyaustriella thionipta]|nr:NADH-quinone oxidoreductase subunit C [gamma proteobacterium symbiont of Bathyaustriella thionipta]
MTAPLSDKLQKLEDALEEYLEDYDCTVEVVLGQMILTLPAEQLVEVALILRSHKAFGFEQLIDVCGVDYSAYGQSEWATETASSTGFGRGVDRADFVAEDDPHRFAAVYQLLSIQNNVRLRLKVYAPGNPPMLDSVVGVWSSADWFEREAFDMYGILFNGHPDLRRILTDYGFVGHPFRKDFPLSGHVEMHYDPERQRVVYAEVEIEPRVLVPRVIRQDGRFVSDQVLSEKGGDDA